MIWRRLCRAATVLSVAALSVPMLLHAQEKSDSAIIAPIIPAAAAPSLGDIVYFPIVFGIRFPAYTRSDGIVIPWGPQLALPDDRLVIDPIITYRSHLGHFDPSLSVVVAPQSSFDLHLLAQRSTFTNDQWTVSNFVNSASVGLTGEDGYNYYRADRLQQKAEWHTPSATAPTLLNAYVGAQWEFDYSVGPQIGAVHQVWSILNHGDTTQILRPNPLINRGHIGSAIAGAGIDWDPGGRATASASLDVEAPWTTPQNAHFVQVTFDGHTTVPTVGPQSLAIDLHAVVTAGDTAPAQRFAYIGGSNTLPTTAMLYQGGDQLVYGSFMYVVPIELLHIPLLGSPSVALHYAVGSAGIQRLPYLTQNVGPRLMLFIFRADYLVDPATHRTAFSLGATLNGQALASLPGIP